MSVPTPVLLAWSGGKDAAWTLHTLRQRSDVEVVGLLTTVANERVAMQGIRREVLHAQAAATGLPVMEATIPSPCSNADYEAAMARALDDAKSRWPMLCTAAFGDLFLEDIRAYRESQCARIGWQVVTPLFGMDTAALAREMMAGGLRARICCVDTEQLDGRFAGREFDETLLDDLPPQVDPCGENGEFHTCVYAGPMFSGPLHLREGDTVLRDGRFAYTDFELVPACPAPLPQGAATGHPAPPRGRRYARQ
jgi:uncharacterized protein (TIGR00290 family)